MCGIAGIFAYRHLAPPAEREELLRVREAMAARGPDGAGLWMSDDQRVGLAHRRLAIIDLSDAGAQPMAAAQGRLRITFNGEIYNYRELRKELEAKGYCFRSDSDTEVLLNLYAERGAEMVGVLRGMYAFAIWDDARKTLFLARDPFGIKPLYFTDDGGTFRFASQVKALLKSDRVDSTPEAAGHVGFFIWGSVPEPYTLYRGIRAMPAGATLRVTSSGVTRPARFFSIAAELVRAEEECATPKSENRSAILGKALRDSVRHHLVSDVPVGIFLSAGLDSTLIAALAGEGGAQSLHGVTLGFREYQGTERDEVPLAEMAARHYGIQHRTRWISKAEFEADLEKLLAAMDQPTIDGVNAYFVSKAAVQAGMKVALSGLGGDELFGGYPSFRHVPRIAATFRFARRFAVLGKTFRLLTAPLLQLLTSPKFAGLLEYGGTYAGAYLLRRALFMPWELEKLLDPATVKAGLEELQPLLRLEKTARGLKSSRQRIAALELEWYMRNQLLRDADWAGMAHSLEIRVPLVDVVLFRKIAPLLAGAGAPTKRDAADTLLKPLPESMLNRRKTGFATPVREWISSGSGSASAQRGLRGWAGKVHPSPPRRFRALALVTDAFGVNGGIAKFNRDFLASLCEMRECSEVVAVPRLGSMPAEPLPPKLTFRAGAAAGKLRYVCTVLQTLLLRRFDLVIVGHIKLLPLALIVSRLMRARLLLVVHGIEAWTRHRSLPVRRSLSYVSGVVAVSAFTLGRLKAWAPVDYKRCHVLPNCVDLGLYPPGPRPQALAQRLGVDGKTVVMTLARLSELERCKGIDEIIDVLPELTKRVPNLVYLVCGEGGDRTRLEQKAKALRTSAHVVFAGFIAEEQKADYFRLADAYVMPGRGEGFGIVYLEAMACGVPVLASRLDGSRNALLDGELGVLVDPDDRQELIEGVLETLKRPRGVPPGLQRFSKDNFRRGVADIVRQFV